MKKIFVLIVGFMLLSAVSAFAAVGSQSDTVYTVQAQGTNPEWSVSLSKNVDLEYDAESSGLAYAAATDHNSGDKRYGSSSGDTKLYYTNNTSATLPAPPSTSSTTSDFSGWTPM